MLALSGCTAQEAEKKDSSKLQIVCTNFPAYDFAREMAGDRAQIKLLIKPGAEVHSYEPAPKEIVAIQESDLFICNGGESEAWVESLVSDDVNVLRMMDCVETLAESSEGIYASDHDHEHEDEHDHDHEEEELDEHVWTTPGNAAKICYALCDKLCELDPDNANEYMLNYEVYNAKLMELDIDIRTTDHERSAQNARFCRQISDALLHARVRPDVLRSLPRLRVADRAVGQDGGVPHRPCARGEHTGGAVHGVFKRKDGRCYLRGYRLQKAAVLLGAQHHRAAV